MTKITTIEELETHYGAAVPRSLTKVADHLTPAYARWIMVSRFMVLSTVGPEGTDASPRGDDGSVVRIDGPSRILLPDWMGNNRIDSLRNIVRDPRVSVMFMVPGSGNVVRVNGQGAVLADADLLASFEKAGKQPRTVIEITVDEVYFQCAKALIRSELWAGRDDSVLVPTAGELIQEAEAGFDAKGYDDGYAEYARPRLW